MSSLITYDPTKSFAHLTGLANGKMLYETLRTLYYAKECYKKRFGNNWENTAYTHNLTMAIIACSHGVYDDILLASLLCYGLCENCNIPLKQLKVSEKVKSILSLITYEENGNLACDDSLKAYYENILTDWRACLAKLIIHVDIVSSMSDECSLEKIKLYIEETEKYILPMYKDAKRKYLDYSDYFHSFYFIISAVTKSAKAIIIRFIEKTYEKPGHTSFDFEKTYSYVIGLARGKKLKETMRAINFARECHSGQMRKNGEPYFSHPLSLVYLAISVGIYDDIFLAALSLHDVPEDCDISIEDLPISEKAKEIVNLLTFNRKYGQEKKEALTPYYDKIACDAFGSLGKLIDRAHNVSTMADVFSFEKIMKYIDETEEFIKPIYQNAKCKFPEYSNYYHIFYFIIKAVIQTIKTLIDKYCKD